MTSKSRHARGVLAVIAALVALCLCLAGCGGSGSSSSSASSSSAASSSAASDEGAKLAVAYQYGLSYAPAVIAKEQGLIEAAYKDATGKDLTIEWNQMNSGADINTGITSGSLQVGFMGVGPAITGITQNLGYKVFTNLSGQEHSLITGDGDVTKLADLVGTDKQIALVNIGSIQHIILAKALADNGEDPHALDSNIVAMKHPDGMASLQNGQVAAHLTSSPYTFIERKDSNLHELSEVNKAWTKDNTFIVGVAAESLHEDADLYKALCTGIEQGAKYISDDPEKAAEILCEFDGNTAEDELGYLEEGNYSTETNGLYELATFMADNGFVDSKPAAYEDLVYDNVKGD